MKIKINKDKCIGCGSCAAICPAVFAVKDGKAEVIGDSAGQEKEVKMARDACPTQAITVEEE